MFNEEVLTANIAGCGNILRHQAVSNANIIQNLLLIKLHDVEAMGYSAKPRHVCWCTMEMMPLSPYIFPSQTCLSTPSTFLPLYLP